MSGFGFAGSEETMLLGKLLDEIIRKGRLTVIDANGRHHVFGGQQAGPTSTIRLHDRTLHWRMFLNPHLVSGEAYMDGKLTIEEGSLYDFVELVAMNIGWGLPDHWLQSVIGFYRRCARRLAQYNPAHRSKQNVAHHYDLSGELYSLFLDQDRQYSCAYFVDDGDDLDTAQRRKKQHLAGKLLLEDGQRILDIGCGWGGLALHLSEEAKVDVTGITLSEEQHKVANTRSSARGTADRVRFELRDYRHVTGTFDRIVSVGMFEHVGIGHYEEYFGKIAELLNDDGVAVLHTIGRADGPGATNPWIDKYIFPGGYSPALSEIVPYIERAGLYITDIEVLRLHYARTLRAWHERFQANRDRIRELYDERFCRMWELYLVGSECAFRYSGHVVFQIQMAKRNDLVPDNRYYIADHDRKMAAKDRADAAPGDSRAA
jgi:cyclopropane-fatty-acyl-phospholipid synthase